MKLSARKFTLATSLAAVAVVGSIAAAPLANAAPVTSASGPDYLTDWSSPYSPSPDTTSPTDSATAVPTPTPTPRSATAQEVSGRMTDNVNTLSVGKNSVFTVKLTNIGSKRKNISVKGAFGDVYQVVSAPGFTGPATNLTGSFSVGAGETKTYTIVMKATKRGYAHNVLTLNGNDGRLAAHVFDGTLITY